MPESIDGGERGDCLEIGTNTVVNVLRPLVFVFVEKILMSFDESGSVAIGPDVGATEIIDDVIYLKNWTVRFDNSADVRKNHLLAVKVFGFLQDAGYEVSGYWGQGFDLKVPIKDFERIISNSDVVMSEIDDTREQFFA